jgi:methylmalonyl-CoA mutase
MAELNDKKLLAEFPAVPTETWEAIIQKDLKGADYEKKLVWNTVDGIRVKPYYRSEDLEGKEFLDPLPGDAPFVRGNKAGANEWEIRQDIRLDNIEEANKKSLFVLQRGITSLGFICSPDLNKRLLKDQTDFTRLLRDIYFECISLNFVCGPNAPSLLAMLQQEVVSKKVDKEKVFGAIDFDPLGYLTITGNWNKNEKDDFNNLNELLLSAGKHLPNYKVLGINGYFLHNAGATVVQELGYSLAMAAEYLAKLTSAGVSADAISSHMQFNLGVGSNYFMEIAKIRAARYLWAKLIGAYSPQNEESKKADIHSITSEWNQTIYDPYMNLLRATTESMAAVIGGTNSLTVRPYTFSYKHTTKFSGRLARNIQIILREEAYLGKVTDPGAGSYYIENLTSAIIDEAWKIVLGIEDAGGYLEALKKGIVQADIASTAQKREDLISTRKEVLLGTNQYPDPAESVSSEIVDFFAFPPLLSENTLVTPVPKYRGAIPFEKLRLAAEKHPKGRPKVFLLTYGDPVMRKARASFATNFFACGGYRIHSRTGYRSVEEGVEAAKEARADLVVLCSSDEEYAETALIAKTKLNHDTLLVVAGAPACMDELKAAGISDFIHLRSNVRDTLALYHQKLGIQL